MNHLSQEELIQITLRLARLKKDNKELLSYLLFWAEDEIDFRNEIKHEIREGFAQIESRRFYLIKKSIRKVLKIPKQAIKYSDDPITAVELLMCFCEEMLKFRPAIHSQKILVNLLETQVKAIEKYLSKIEPDLRHDYQKELEQILNKNP